MATTTTAQALLDQLGGACAPSLHQSSESSLFRDLLDQYNEMKMKYQELKVGSGSLSPTHHMRAPLFLSLLLTR